MSEFIRVVKSTISDFLKDEEINVLKNQKLTGLLMQKKRISYGHSGKSLFWPVRAARNGMLPYTDAAVLAFNRVNREQDADLPWRSYAMPEAVTKKEKLMNRGRQALVNYATRLGEFIRDDIKYNFNAELYVDGTTNANADRIHGLQSCLGNNGAAQYPTPNSTYAGLATNLGNYGGAPAAGSTWPLGQFDPLYYFWSPTLVSYTNTAWGATSATWANNCLASVRKGKLISQNLKGRQGKTDLIVTDPSMYGDFLDAFSAKERIECRRGGESSGLVKLGFEDVVNFDGTDITSEADCPVGNGFGLSFDALELCSMQDQMFDLDEMDDINTLSNKIVGCFFGNLKMNPRGLTQWVAAG